jgi:outer membrane protein assembly factor BamB
VTGKTVARDAQLFSPPALGREWMYLSGAAGHIVSVRQSSGEAGFAYAFGKPMVFQPALARGNVYAGTQDGYVICLKTGSADADGWFAWGGNPQHNR